MTLFGSQYKHTLVWFVYQIIQPEPCIRRSHGTHKDILHPGPSAISMTTLHHSNIIRDATKLLYFVLIPKHQLCESVMIWWCMRTRRTLLQFPPDWLLHILAGSNLVPSFSSMSSSSEINVLNEWMLGSCSSTQSLTLHFRKCYQMYTCFLFAANSWSWKCVDSYSLLKGCTSWVLEAYKN